MARKLLLMRHGDVYDNPGGERVLYGNLPGFWLSQLGIRQCLAAGEFLRNHCKIDMAVVSPLERTRQTAAIVIERNPADPSIVYEPLIRDIGVDPWQGQLPRKAWTDNRDEFWQMQTEQRLEGLEHPDQIRQRMVTAFEKHAAEHPDKTILFVSHGDPICFLLQHYRQEKLEPLIHYHLGVNKADIFQVDLEPVTKVAKLFEPLEYGTVYPRPEPAIGTASVPQEMG